MPTIQPIVQGRWVKMPHALEAIPVEEHFDPPGIDPKIWVQQPSPRNFEQELYVGLYRFPPTPTKTGINGSFFLYDSKGQRLAIFKPMNMEAGACKNHRLRPSQNVQFRTSILPGQGAGNEVLAYELDRRAFAHHYQIPKTVLVRLTSLAFEGEEIGSAQEFITHARSLDKMTPWELDKIPQREWEKLNFRLISGSTDAHYGNILYCDSTQKLYLIDSGDDFVGEDGQCEYYNPWTQEPRCQQPMSAQESRFLSNLNIDEVMRSFRKQARINEQDVPTLKISLDKHLTQIIRLLLAKTVGHFQLTQAEWAQIMHQGSLERIYNQYVRPYWKTGGVINWNMVQKELEAAAHKQISKRRLEPLPFAPPAEKPQFFGGYR